jgi:hypothetical protein
MFEEQYRRDNERLHAPEDALRRIKERAGASTPRRVVWTRYAAAAAALLLVCTGAFSVLRARGGTGMDAAEPEAPMMEAAAREDVTEDRAAGSESDTAAESEEQNGAPMAYACTSGDLAVPADYDELYLLLAPPPDADLAAASESASNGETADGAADGWQADAADAGDDANDAEGGSAGATAAGGDSAGDDASSSADMAASLSPDNSSLAADGGQVRYLLAGGTLSIFDTAGGEEHLLSRTDLPIPAGEALALYSCGDRLAVVFMDERTAWDGDAEPVACVLLLDVTDPTAPETMATLAQSGRYASSFSQDGMVLVVTTYALDGAAVPHEPRSFCPTLYDASGATALEADDIRLLTGDAGEAYTVVACIDTAVPETFDSACAVLAGDCAAAVQADADNLTVLLGPDGGPQTLVRFSLPSKGEAVVPLDATGVAP